MPPNTDNGKNVPTPLPLLLQAHDGLPVTDCWNQKAHCDECDQRIREGADVVAHTKLNDGRYQITGIYHPDCHADHETAEIVLSARLVYRRDCSIQSSRPVLSSQRVLRERSNVKMFDRQERRAEPRQGGIAR